MDDDLHEVLTGAQRLFAPRIHNGAGDSACALPPITLGDREIGRIREATEAIARYLEAQKVLPLERKGRKSVAWSRTGVVKLIGSRVYRGELWDGDELLCKNAHKAIVSESQWRFAQRGGKGGRTQVKDGSIAAQGILSSIVYCAACGYRLSLTGSTGA